MALAAGMALCTVICGGESAVYGANSSGQSAAASMMAALGVISADSSGNYNLEQNVTRKQFAKMLVEVSPYSEQVMTGVYSAPFKDVAASDWSAPYIRVAVSNGIFSGYSDGTFRPDDSVTLAQAVNSVLLLLGYEQSDFRGAFPYAQMNLYQSTGLSAGIGSTASGSAITRGEAVQLLYNLMKTNVKDGTKKYAETLGYSVNGSGEVDYASVVSDNMYGPYTVESAAAWAGDLGVDKNNVTVYKNGSIISVDEVAVYDVLYYTANKDTIYAYSNKVTGIYEKAEPSQNNPTSVTISGKKYEIESTAAFAALSSGGTVKVGDAVTLLLGKNGGIADAVRSGTVEEEVVVYVTETGEKTYEDGNGYRYTSDYIKGVTAAGNEAEYPVRSSYVSEGDAVSVRFNGSGVTVSDAPKSSVSGVVNASQMTIGTTPVAEYAAILDCYNGSYTVTGMNRLDGLRLSDENVLYCAVENGRVTQLILDNVTGDALDYGLVLSASSNSSGMNLSGSYTYDLDGVTKYLTTQNSSLSVSRGPAAIYVSNGSTVLRNLSQVSGTARDMTSGYVTIGGKKCVYSPEVKIYIRSDSTGDYRLGSVADAVSVFNDKSDSRTIRFYEDFDKTADSGSRIRVITIG